MNLKSGTATFTVPESLEDKFPSGSFTSSLPLPAVATIGFVIKPSEKLSIAMDVNRVGWVAFDTLGFDYAVNTESLEDTKSPRNYENTFAFRLFVFEVIKSNPNISEVEIDKISKITGNETSTVICVILMRIPF